MLNTGITRRVDDLGRVVIPKEIRKNLHICEGETLDIAVDEDKIIFSKHSWITDIKNEAKRVAQAISNSLKLSVAICDDDKIIAVSGIQHYYIDARISKEDVCKRDTFDSTQDDSTIYPIMNNSTQRARFIQPIFRTECNCAEVVGAIIVFESQACLMKTEEFSKDAAKMLLESYATYLSDILTDKSI